MNVPHRKISYQRCLNASCGQPVRRDRLEEARAAAREHERLAEEAAQRHAALRMAEEVEGYELPTGALKIEYTPTSAREQAEIRARRAELEAEERAAREETSARFVRLKPSYSEWEVEQMSSDEMKRKLQLTVDKRQLPLVGPSRYGLKFG